MNLSLTNLLAGLVLALLQMLAAAPWLLVFFRSGLIPSRKKTSQAMPAKPGPSLANELLGWAKILGAAYLAILLPMLALLIFIGRDWLETLGLIYVFVLQVQLLIDFFLLVFWVLLLIWPKGGAVAQAAFREGVRQPMFWLLLGVGFLALTISPFIPYFTFGEDHIMVKEIGYDTLMLVATVFGALAASTSIGEEIEGRTAVTLMSKPVSRRQFLLGKFVGILLAALLMFGLLSCYFEGILLYKAWWDRVDPVPLPAWITATLKSLAWPSDLQELTRGVCLWLDHTVDTLPGLILGFCQVMVLLAVSVALAVRVPMVVNICTVVVVYLAAHLTPNLISIGQKVLRDQPESPVGQVLTFMSKVFDTILPALDFFRISPALIGEAPPPTVPFYLYVGSVAFYGCLYTAIVLLFGLILFEDRDLA